MEKKDIFTEENIDNLKTMSDEDLDNGYLSFDDFWLTKFFSKEKVLNEIETRRKVIDLATKEWGSNYKYLFQGMSSCPRVTECVYC